MNFHIRVEWLFCHSHSTHMLWTKAATLVQTSRVFDCMFNTCILGYESLLHQTTSDHVCK